MADSEPLLKNKDDNLSQQDSYDPKMYQAKDKTVTKQSFSFLNSIQSISPYIQVCKLEKMSFFYVTKWLSSSFHSFL